MTVHSTPAVEQSNTVDGRDTSCLRGDEALAAFAGWLIAGWRLRLLAALAVAVLGAVLIGNRGRYDRWDFVTYYSWWSEVDHGIDPWRPAEAHSAQSTVQQCNYTPFFVLVLSPLGRFHIRTAFWLWQAFQVLSLIATMALLGYELAPRAGPSPMVAAAALALLFPPVHETLHAGQTALLLLFLATAAWLLARRSRPAAAGLMLALGALLKAYPAALGGYFLFRRRFDVVAWAIVFFVLGVAGSEPRRWAEFFVYGVPRAHTFYLHDRAVAILCNVYQFPLHFWRTGFSPAVAVGITIAACLTLIVLAARATANAPDDVEVDGLCFGLWLAVALLAAPISFNHELPLLLPIYVFAAAALLRGRRTPPIAFVLMIAAIAFAVIPLFAEWLRHFQFYCLSALATFGAAVIMVRAWTGDGRAGSQPSIEMKGSIIDALP